MSQTNKKHQCSNCQGEQFEVWVSTPCRVDLEDNTAFNSPNGDYTEIFCLGCHRELDAAEFPELWDRCLQALENSSEETNS